MSREVPYDQNLICDSCGKPGAFDFMGDYYCNDCLQTDEEGVIIGVDLAKPGSDLTVWRCPRCGLNQEVIWGMTDCANCGLHFECC